MVHAHAGTLPTKAIGIPNEKYAAALQQINITFLTTPLLTPKDNIAVSLPQEAGYEWSWIAKKGNAWKQVGTTGMVTINDFTSLFKNGKQIWQALIDNSWIQTQDNVHATILPTDQRLSDQLGDAFSTQLNTIEAILKQSQIEPFQYDASFSSSQEVVEGWLKLSPQQLQNKNS
jgi:hypothetical protein